MKVTNRLTVFLFVVLAFLSTINVSVATTPAWMLWGNSDYIHFDKTAGVWINDNPQMETWRHQGPTELVIKLCQPERVPAKKQLVLSFRKDLLADRRYAIIPFAMGGVALSPSPRRRLVLINAEQTADYEARYKTYAHLGLAYVATAAKQVGWDVVCHDELVEGHCDLATLTQPGDTVGISCVVTGVERAIELARQAKELGAYQVVAGNDAAIFAADQLLHLPGKPFDAVFTSNSVVAVRQYFLALGRGDKAAIRRIRDLRTEPTGITISNSESFLRDQLQERKQLERAGEFDRQDVFIVPDFSVFSQDYLEKTWSNYRAIYGSRHTNPTTVRNALFLPMQGCPKTAGWKSCTYCSINGIGDIRMGSEEYFRKAIQAYRELGITQLFLVADSAYSNGEIPDRLQQSGFLTGTVYGNAQDVARKPQLIERWQQAFPERFVINMGLDSGDKELLDAGVGKSHPALQATADCLWNNHEALRQIKQQSAYAFFSLIFGIPGETKEASQRSLDFGLQAIAYLGRNLDTAESDMYWVNRGAPAWEVTQSYPYAQELAAKNKKDLSFEAWQSDFGQHTNAIVTPWSVQEAWFHWFTGITIDYAYECNRILDEANRKAGNIHGRAFKPNQQA